MQPSSSVLPPHPKVALTAATCPNVNGANLGIYGWQHDTAYATCEGCFQATTRGFCAKQRLITPANPAGNSLTCKVPMSHPVRCVRKLRSIRWTAQPRAFPAAAPSTSEHCRALQQWLFRLQKVVNLVAGIRLMSCTSTQMQLLCR